MKVSEKMKAIQGIKEQKRIKRNQIIEKYSNEKEYSQDRFYPISEDLIKPSEISIRQKCNSGSYTEPDGCFYYPETQRFLKIVTQ